MEDNKIENSILEDAQEIGNEGAASEVEQESILSEEQQASFDEELALEQEFGNSDTRTFLESAVSSATFGISDQAIVEGSRLLGGDKNAEEAQTALRERRKRNSEASIAGEIAGVVAPALASGGTSLAAKAATRAGSAVNAASKAGLAVEGISAKALTRILGETGKKKIAKDVILKSLSKGSGSAVEGAFYGAGELIKEDALGTAEFNAENLIASVGAGALIGGAAGSVLGSATAVLPVFKNNRVVDAVSKKINTNISKAKQISTLLGFTPKQLNKQTSTQFGQKVVDNFEDHIRNNLKLKQFGDDTVKLAEKNNEFKRQSAEEIGNIIQQINDEAIEGSVKISKKQLGTQIQTQLQALKKEFQNSPSTSAKNSLKQIQKEIDSFNDWVNPVIPSNPIKPIKPVKPSKKDFQVADNLTGGRKLDKKAYDKTLADFTKKNNTYIKELKTFRSQKNTFKKSINNKINSDKLIAKDIQRIKISLQNAADHTKSLADTPLKGQIERKLASATREYLEEIAGKVSSSDNPLVSRLRKSNLDYATAVTIAPRLDDKIAKQANRKGLSLSDVVLGGVFGGGISIGAGAVAVGVRKFAESDFKRRLVILADIEKFNKRVNTKLSKNIKNFFAGSKRSIIPASTQILLNTNFQIPDEYGKKKKTPKNKKEAFKKISEDLTELVNNPEKLINHLATNAAKTSEAAPNTGAAMDVTLSAAISFLHEKLPKDASFGGGLLTRKWEPSSLELAKFERYLAAVENPLSVLDDLESNTLTREGVEALRVVYPDLYQRVQEEAINQVAENPDITYNKKLQLGSLLDIPVDASLIPQNIAALQQQFADLEQQQNAAKKEDNELNQKGVSELSFADDQKSGTEKVSTRE